MIDIIGKKYYFLGFSAALVVLSIGALLVYGLHLGIDFTGGSILEIEFPKDVPQAARAAAIVESFNVGSVAVQETGERGMLIRFGAVAEDTHQNILGELRRDGGGEIIEKRFDSIGPTIGSELRRNAFIALSIAVAAIILYIAWAFRHVSEPVSSWKYGVVAVFALVHDIIIPTGVFAVLGKFYGVSIDALFITALLTIMGFSVHDTIVVFDRTRENLYKLKGKGNETFAHTVNQSVNETIARSVNTSVTILLALVAIALFGGESVRYFAIALIIGITFGTYSSIFVASPLLVIWESWSGKRKQ
ncbi:MAG: protein-export membrane protein SecF [Candidatus Sungbacteria bacterium RIFCSPHIGHO2_01_FULL_50_25]|uniref:Protein-export membrane protein SecF n=1 Tax=Candidatus Sungbacteria bacterium RIFCSPHIGHO2_01_FULL_50_25 TaxID=1802265 RepID=A0A1G2K6E9_9BACT|nr:MAG: protein-export membrane protein SecF [Candidatus Sungbacteria bacterium RIFCSPHIGHO2_01_FULL_50_25]